MFKKCNHCLVEKDLSEFYNNKTGKFGKHVECKVCSRVRTKACTAKNKPIRAAYNKQWKKDNAEHVSIYNQKYSAQYYLGNKEKINKNSSTYKTEKRRSDPATRLAHNLRRRLNHVIRGTIKSGSAVRDLGCTIEELVKRIENLWESGMTWENYGCGKYHWNVDHIIPLSAFDLMNREQFLKANHFSNLQPMWHRLNIIKSDKVS